MIENTIKLNFKKNKNSSQTDYELDCKQTLGSLKAINVINKLALSNLAEINSSVADAIINWLKTEDAKHLLPNSYKVSDVQEEWIGPAINIDINKKMIESIHKHCKIFWFFDSINIKDLSSQWEKSLAAAIINCSQKAPLKIISMETLPNKRLSWRQN